jgi:hypothetical protein
MPAGNHTHAPTKFVVQIPNNCDTAVVIPVTAATIDAVNDVIASLLMEPMETPNAGNVLTHP